MLSIHTEYSGAQFNEIYKGITLYKFLNNNLTHNGFRYVLGSNKDDISFNPNGMCSNGGLYFCDEFNCHLYWRDYGEKIAIITIPDDARVYIEQGKFKADKINVYEIIDFEQMPDDFWIKLSQKDGMAFKYVKNQTDEICILAVKQNGNALEYVQNQTEEICCLSVSQNGRALADVQNQTEKICKLAIHEHEWAFRLVKEQTYELCKLVVTLSSDMIEFVNEQFLTEELYILAVRNKTKEICDLAI